MLLSIYTFGRILIQHLIGLKDNYENICFRIPRMKIENCGLWFNEMIYAVKLKRRYNIQKEYKKEWKDTIYY